MNAISQSTLLADLRLLDFGSGMSAALVAKTLVEHGIDTLRIEPEDGDPFYDLLPAYRAWQAGKEIVRSGSVQDRLVAAADICIVGGDDHPALGSRPSPEALRRINDRLIVLSIEGQPDGFGTHDLPASDLLVQARMGITNEVFGRHPVASPFPAATYGAALNGSLGVWGALLDRERTGHGQIVRVSFAEAVLTWVGPMWLDAASPAPATAMIVPRNARHLIFRCADGRYIHITLGVANAIPSFLKLLGIKSIGEGLDDRGMPAQAADEDYFGDLTGIQVAVSSWQSAALVGALERAGIPVEYVQAPGECWDEDQVKANGIIRSLPDGTAYVGSPFVVTQEGDAR